MNYLAHLFLSDGTPESLLGNLMGDFVKGKDTYLHLPPAVRRGIELHRKVDAFTDHHPIVHRSIQRLDESWGHWRGVIVDVYYDHLLATTWERYTSEPFSQFISHVHAVLWGNEELMPPRMRDTSRCLVANDRLRSYARLSGIAATLYWISERIFERPRHYDVRLEQALPDLREKHDELASDFALFFPEAIRFARESTSRTPAIKVPRSWEAVTVSATQGG